MLANISVTWKSCALQLALGWSRALLIVATVLLASAVTPGRFTGVPKVKRKGALSMKKISQSMWMPLTAGLGTVMILSGIAFVWVIFPLRLLASVP